MEPSFENITVADDGGVRRIELNRPDALNAWIPELGRELYQALAQASADTAVRAILITGAGRAFSSGADLRYPRAMVLEDVPDLSSWLRTIYNPVMLMIRDAPKPVVAAVNGPAVGVGAALALACDLIVASESSYLLLAFVNIGLVPDGAASYLLASRCGYARAAQLAMLGERLPAARALEWGVFTEVYPDDQFASSAAAFAARLGGGPTVAYANMKRALRAGSHDRLAEQLELDASLQQRQALTSDRVEGVEAFKEKRPPVFLGR
jgi:2-(1,2-epoxy-1,2-dihydrophenyl)acetyl-CoA isomerase